MFKISLREKKSQHMFERTPRYDVLLNGEPVSELYFNMGGYRGAIPSWRGGMFDPGEIGIARWKREISAMNREAKSIYAEAALATDRVLQVYETTDDRILNAAVGPACLDEASASIRIAGIYRDQWARFSIRDGEANPAILLFEELEPRPVIWEHEGDMPSVTQIRDCVEDSLPSASKPGAPGAQPRPMWHVASRGGQELMVDARSIVTGPADSLVSWQWRRADGPWTGLLTSGSVDVFLSEELGPALQAGARLSTSMENRLKMDLERSSLASREADALDEGMSL